MPCLPFYSSAPCIWVSRLGIHRCQCPSHTGSRCPPSRFHTDRTSRIYIEEYTAVLDRMLLQDVNKDSVDKPYLTGDWPVSFRLTLSIDITGVGQTVATADLRLTAFDLISCVTCLTAATVIRALGREDNFDRVSVNRNAELLHWMEWNVPCSLTTELWQIEFSVQPPLLAPLHSSMSSQTWMVKNEKSVASEGLFSYPGTGLQYLMFYEKI